MRTVTFSDRRVVAGLKKNWHCAWKNLSGEESAGSSFAHSPKDPPPSCSRGNGEHNVQILFLDREGRLLNVVAGYLGAEDLITEMDRSLEIARAIQGKKEEAARSRVRREHEKARQKIRNEADEGPFASFIRNRRLSDHRFMTRNPLMSWDDFSTVALVGHGKSFFGSSKGRPPKDRIGKDIEIPGRRSGSSQDEEREDMDEMIRRLLEGQKKKKGKTEDRKKRRRPTSLPTKRV